MKSTHALAIACFAVSTSSLGCETSAPLGRSGAPENYTVHKVDFTKTARPGAAAGPDDSTNLIGQGQVHTLLEANENVSQIVTMALTDNYLYFAASWDGVYRLPKYGGPVEVVEAGAKHDGRVLMATKDSVIWVKTHDDGSDHPITEIKRRSENGGPTSVLFAGDWGIATTNLAPALQGDATGVYMMAFPIGIFMPHLHHFPAAGGPPRKILTVPEFWLTWLRDDGRIYLASKTELPHETAIEVLDDGAAEPRTLAVLGEQTLLRSMDRDFLYGVTLDGIVRVAKKDGVASEVLKLEGGRHLADVLISDEEKLYFTTVSRDEPADLRSFSKRDGTITVLASGRTFEGPWQIAQDSRLIYLLHDRGRKIAVVAKTPAL